MHNVNDAVLNETPNANEYRYERDKIIMKRIVYTTVHQIISFYLILLLAQMLSLLKPVV